MKPKPNEYDSYYETYISALPDFHIKQILEEQIDTIQNMFSNMDEEKGNFAYSEGKWTIKEVLGHIVDTERIFSYRALSFARGETQKIPGYDQNEYVAKGNFNKRSINSLIYEFTYLRKSNIILLLSFDEETLNNKGNANGKQITVNALLYILAGHVNHHIKVLKEKYFI